MRMRSFVQNHQQMFNAPLLKENKISNNFLLNFFFFFFLRIFLLICFLISGVVWRGCEEREKETPVSDPNRVFLFGFAIRLFFEILCLWQQGRFSVGLINSCVRFLAQAQTHDAINKASEQKAGRCTGGKETLGTHKCARRSFPSHTHTTHSEQATTHAYRKIKSDTVINRNCFSKSCLFHRQQD